MGYVLLVSEFLKTREKLLEEEADRLEKTNTKYENIKNSNVTVEGNLMKICDPTPSATALKKATKKEEEKKAPKKETVKKEAAEVVVPPKPALPENPILRKRFNRGPCV